MRKGQRVRVELPATADRGESQFHGKQGILAYRSDIGKRWFVNLDGDRKDFAVEFMPSELVLINDRMSAEKQD